MIIDWGLAQLQYKMDRERATDSRIRVIVPFMQFGDFGLGFEWSAEVNPNDYVARKSHEMELCPTTISKLLQ